MSSENSGIFNYLEQEKLLSSRSPRVPHALAIVASTVIILAGIKVASGLIGPMLLALFLAIVLLVPLRWLQNHGCPQFLSFLIVLICSTALFAGITYFVASSLNEFVSKIPVYKDRVVDKYNEVEEWVKTKGFQFGSGEKIPSGMQGQTGAEQTAPGQIATPPGSTGATPVIVPTQNTTDKTPLPSRAHEWTSLVSASCASCPLPSELFLIASAGLLRNIDDEELAGTDGRTGSQETLIQRGDVIPLSPEETKEWLEQAAKVEELPSLIALDPQIVAIWFTRAVVYAQKMIEGGFLVIIFTVFMLFEASYFPGKVNRAFGKDGPINIAHFNRIADDVRRYLYLKTLANLMSGSAAMFVYYLFGVPAFFFWGIVAFFMYFIPNIGGTLAAVIPGILIFMNGGILYLLLYAVCLLTIECTIAYGIEPKMLGHGLRLSTMVIILSLFFWGFLLGAIGLFLAAPLTVMIKIILQAFPETRWLAVFLEGGREKQQVHQSPVARLGKIG